VLQVPGDELVQRAAKTLGLATAKVPDLLTRLGRELGPPWTADHKAATLAAVLAVP
jgi:phosphoserine phosphatase